MVLQKPTKSPSKQDLQTWWKTTLIEKILELIYLANQLDLKLDEEKIPSIEETRKKAKKANTLAAAAIFPRVSVEDWCKSPIKKSKIRWCDVCPPTSHILRTAVEHTHKGKNAFLLFDQHDIKEYSRHGRGYLLFFFELQVCDVLISQNLKM